MESPILIPNPLYDVVFRYLMDNPQVAKLVLTAILGERVSELEFQATEQSLKLAEKQHRWPNMLLPTSNTSWHERLSEL